MKKILTVILMISFLFVSQPLYSQILTFITYDIDGNIERILNFKDMKLDDIQKEYGKIGIYT